MHNAPPLHLSDYLGPVAGAIVFVLVMRLVREPARRHYNAILVAGASGVYLAGPLGPWELLYAAAAGGVVAYIGLRSYRFIGVGWLMHSGWDLLHHFQGSPIWPFMPTSSFGCMIFDALIGIWFLAGAPSAWALGPSFRLRCRDTGTGTAPGPSPSPGSLPERCQSGRSVRTYASFQEPSPSEKYQYEPPKVVITRSVSPSPLKSPGR